MTGRKSAMGPRRRPAESPPVYGKGGRASQRAQALPASHRRVETIDRLAPPTLACPPPHMADSRVQSARTPRHADRSRGDERGRRQQTTRSSSPGVSSFPENWPGVENAGCPSLSPRSSGAGFSVKSAPIPSPLPYSGSPARHGPHQTPAVRPAPRPRASTSARPRHRFAAQPSQAVARGLRSGIPVEWTSWPRRRARHHYLPRFDLHDVWRGCAQADAATAQRRRRRLSRRLCVPTRCTVRLEGVPFLSRSPT